MNVLVTGGAGYIGSHTVQKLLRAGFNPIVYDNFSSGFSSAIPNGVKWVEGDVLDVAHLTKTMKEFSVEAIIHFAAKLVVPESVEKPLEYYENNVVGTLRTLQACRNAGVKKFIFSSTAAVYGNPANIPVTEEEPPSPLNPYGMSKLMSERMIQDYAKTSSLQYVVIRYFNVAGGAIDASNGQRTKNATHLVKVAAETACGHRPQIEIFGTDYPTVDGTGVRDYIHVDDLADAHVMALEYINRGGSSEVINAGYGRGYSVRQVLESIAKVSGKTLKILTSPRRAGDAASIVADNHKICRVLGWKPQHDNLELICKTAFEWERDNKSY